MVLVGLYLPPPASIAILTDIMTIALKYDTLAVFLMGDYNMVPCPALDRLHGMPLDTSALTQWASTFVLTDVWRHLHPDVREYTCHSATFKSLSWIDLAFASSDGLCWVTKAFTLSRGVSDHDPISMTLSLSPYN